MRAAGLTFLALLFLVALGTSAAGAAGYIEFRGQRYYPTLGAMEASLGIGFDPVNQRVLSVAETDICGGNAVQRAGNNGVAWDPVNGEFWMINANRQVYKFGAGNTPQVIFQIPQTFNVPGVGSQTLHSPQGLAVDTNHVYVVDFGPNLGQANSNQWFKFTRTGAPVSSSALTDFNAGLQEHQAAFGDAPADGIVWVPPGAPMDGGLFYVAVEHSGIMVLDANGFVVDNFLWTENGLTYGQHVPFAFADLTIDPATGDLYLVENAGLKTHVWVRLPDGPQAIVHGVWGNRVLGPDVRCVRPRLVPATDLFFSLTYRTADGMLWSNSFNSGEIFTIDPLSGRATSKGFSTITDAWGMAYDEERDVIYVYQEFPQRLHVMNPNTLGSSVLNASPGYVRELAFNSDDKAIYGVGNSTLVRYNRDTGARTNVGPTVEVAGIAYDPIAHVLVGRDQVGSKLYNIDPVTGQFQIRAQLKDGSAWEGLAIIPVPDLVTAVESPNVGAGSGTLALQAYPNPIASRGDVSFAMPRAGHVTAHVYDLAGRRVSTLYQGDLPAGFQRLAWNGRDAAGRAVASGTYLIEVTTPWDRGSTKVLVAR